MRLRRRRPFGAHVDTNELTDRVRVISCVYYFARTPGAFGGGELRLYGFPVRSRNAPVCVDIVPETDTLVAFPSWWPPRGASRECTERELDRPSFQRQLLAAAGK